MIHWLARWSLSRRLDEGDAPGPMLRRHIDGCEACRAYERRLGAVDAALRQQVMRAPSPAPVAAAAGSRLAVTGFAAAAMAAVAYLVVAVAVPKPAERSGVAIVEGQRGEPAFSLTGSLGRALGEASLAGPLENELAALERDGRRGLRAILDISGLE